MKTYRQIYIIVFMLLSYSGMAQQSSYVQYTVNDGLPSNHLYQALQDKKGYMWFATEGGVAKFDGRNWKKFTTKDGLPTNDIYQMVEDGNGRIWLQGVSNLVSYIEGDSVKILDIDISFFNGNAVNISSMKLEQNTIKISYEGEIEVYIHMDLSMICHNGINVHRSFYGRKDKTHSEIKNVEEDGKDYYLGKTDEKLYKIDQAGKYIDSLNFPKASRLGVIFGGKDNFINDKHLFVISQFKSDVFVCSYHDFTLKKTINLDSIFGESPTHIRYEWQDGKLQIQSNLGVLILNNIERIVDEWEMNVVKTNNRFSGKGINRVFLDRYNGIWILCKNEGVKYIPDNNFLKDDTAGNTQSFQSLLLIDNDLFAGDKFGNLFKNDLQISGINFVSSESDESIQQLAYNHVTQEILIVKDGQGLMTYNISSGIVNNLFEDKMDEIIENYSDNNSNVKSYVLANKDHIVSVPNSIAIIDERLYYCGNRFLFRINESSFEIDTLLKMSVKKIISNNQNLFSFYLNDLTISDKSFKTLKYFKYDYSIVDIIKYQKNGLVLLNNGDIYIASADKTLPIQLNIKPNGGKTLILDELLWVASNTGLYAYSYNGIKFNLEKFKVCRGINEFIIKSDTIYLATDYGIDKFNVHFENNIVSNANLFIRVSDLVNNTDLTSVSDLSYFENNLKFEFDYLDYSCQGNYTMDIRLISSDTIKIQSSAKEYSFPNLEPNDYKLEYQVFDFLGRESVKKEYYFKIHGPWWSSSQFIGFSLISLGFLGLYIYQLSINRIKKKEEQQTEINRKMAELKLSALQSQMNPHFIFNSLNSIQHLIQLSDNKKADLYLSRFSELLRSFLENSKDKFVPLSKELDLLMNYCNLELLRFDNKFDLEFVNELELEKEKSFVIPTNILQPIIENAINHGLFHKKEKGILSIHIKMQGQQLKVIVEDNGIGREEAEKINLIRNRNYKSFGMEILHEKLEVLRKVDNYITSVEYIDLYDKPNNPKGTRVILLFSEYQVRL